MQKTHYMQFSYYWLSSYFPSILYLDIFISIRRISLLWALTFEGGRLDVLRLNWLSSSWEGKTGEKGGWISPAHRHLYLMLSTPISPSPPPLGSPVYRGCPPLSFSFLFPLYRSLLNSIILDLFLVSRRMAATKKFVNSSDTAVDDSIRGLISANANLNVLEVILLIIKRSPCIFAYLSDFP